MAFGIGAGCGGSEGNGSPELLPFEHQADTAVAALEEDSKSDTPNPNALPIFEISPGTVVAHDVAPARPLVGLTFRAEDAAAINANAALRTVPPVIAPPIAPSPPLGPTVNLVLYRRTSCLGRWERVPNASSTAVLATRLPEAGEYLLVTGATNPSSTATLSASFAADTVGAIVKDKANRNYKIAQSWLPADAVKQVNTAGVRRFSQLRSQNLQALSQRTGLPKPALDELSALAGWLDTDGVTYEQACALKRAGADDAAGYYRLPRAKQRALAPLVPEGSLPLPPPTCRGGRCTDPVACVSFDAPSRQPNDDRITRPFINWQSGSAWSGTPYPLSKPWMTAPGSPNIDERWYPDPAQGWDLLSYNFGGQGPNADLTSNASENLGYILFHQRHSGLMRLFVWVHKTPNYHELAVHLGVADEDRPSIPTGWVFPNEPTFPGQLSNSAIPSRSIGHGTTVLFNADGLQTIQPHTWLRSEFSVLHDPSFYPAPAEGTVSFPGDPPIGFQAKRFSLRFEGFYKNIFDLYLEANAKMSGTAKVSQPKLEAGNTDLAVNAGTKIYEGNYVDGAKNALAYGFGEDLPDWLKPRNRGNDYDIFLAGVISGDIYGVSTSQGLGLGEVFFRLDGTYDPTSINVDLARLGGTDSVQRCAGVQLGTVYLSEKKNQSLDPSPPFFDAVIDYCNGGNNIPALRFGANSCLSRGNHSVTITSTDFSVGSLRAARGLAEPIRISGERVTLEVIGDADPRTCRGPSCTAPAAELCPRGEDCYQPTKLLVANGDFSPADTGAATLRFWDLPYLASTTWRRYSGYLSGTDVVRSTKNIKVYLRWHANLYAPGRNDPFQWEYAQDITDRLRLNVCNPCSN